MPSKWYTVDARHRLIYAVSHPLYAARVVWREIRGVDERFLAGITGTSPRQITSFLSEPFADAQFLEHLERCDSEVASASAIPAAHFFAKKVTLQYAVARALRPHTVVETGVQHGVSSAYILKALEANGSGSLHSIDVGENTEMPPGRELGWVPPSRLRSRWSLQIEDSRTALPRLMAEISPIDLFIQDSLHTYDHMMFEFEVAYPALRPGGILMADDATWNASFDDFARQQRVEAQVMHGVGVLAKGSQGGN
jgi:predicted O-methyltransferase YrrM